MKCDAVKPPKEKNVLQQMQMYCKCTLDLKNSNAKSENSQSNSEILLNFRCELIIIPKGKRRE